MRKINELTSDEFFDVLCAISPILHIILNMKLVQGFLFKKYDDELLKVRREQKQYALLMDKEKDQNKKEKFQEKLKDALEKGNEVITQLMAKDIMDVVPKFASKEYRQCIYEVFAIVDKTSVEDVKLYPANELTKKIQLLVSDSDFKSFLSYAEKSELTE